MEVSNRRPADPEIKAGTLQQEAAYYRKAIARIEAMEEELESEIWKEIKERMTALVKSIDDQEYQYAKGEKIKCSLDCLLGQKAAAIDVLSVEEFVKSKGQFETKLKEIEEKIGKLPKSK